MIREFKINKHHKHSNQPVLCCRWLMFCEEFMITRILGLSGDTVYE